MLIIRYIIRKNRSLSLFFKNEKGSILLPFIILLPLFSGLLFLSFEISQFLQKKAKLSDAIEQAALALTVENNGIPDAKQMQKNSDLVTHYATAYLPSEKFSIPIIDINNNSGHLVYKAETTMSYPAKFLANNPLANTEISMADKGAARKDIAAGPSELTDVVFVVDYSDSMNFPFTGSGSTTKIEILREIFHRLNANILKNDNIKTIGFIPFSWGTKKIVGTGSQSKKYCHFPFVPKQYNLAGDYLRKYTPVNLKQFLTPKTFREVKSIGYGRLHLDENKDTYKKVQEEITQKKSTFAEDFLFNTYNISKNHNIIRLIKDNIDYDKTISSMSNIHETIDIPTNDVLHSLFCVRKQANEAEVYSLEFNNVSESTITQSLATTPIGATLVSSGILSANNLFKNSNSKNKKLMIVLSDGDDSGNNMTINKLGKPAFIEKYITVPDERKTYYITKNLIDKGMCEAIADNHIRMVFIAIGYTPQSNANSPTYIDWEKCVGKDNFYLAKDAHELEADLQQALGGENIRDVGRNTPKH